MINRPSQSLKKVAAELAGLVSSGSGDTARINELLSQLGYAPQLPAPDTGTPPPPVPDQSIGIWKKSVADGKPVYQRDEQMQADWHLWANVKTLYPKGAKKRVVLLGESVARGYLYDPYYTVAMELEATLNGVPRVPDCEVIDLARTSMRIPGLRETIRSCVALQPDHVVIFAGNNWLAQVLGSITAEEYRTLLTSYVREPLSSVKAFFEDRMASVVTEVLTEVQAVLVNNHIPVTFVVPGFNLGDWKSDDQEKILSWLPQNRLSEWLEAKAAAEQALAAGEYDRLGARARQMTGLYPAHPLGHEWLAQSHRENGAWQDALACLEDACDAVLFGRSANSKPRCCTPLRDALLAQAGKYGIATVNLPEILVNAAPDNIPGREMYLDYCHLTLEGIKIAVRHTARVVAGALTGRQVALEEVADSGLEPAASVQATAHFCAAVHSGHYGQPRAILDYHCRKAVSLSAGIKDTMLRFADFATRRTSSEFCQSFGEVLAEGGMLQYEGGRGMRNPKGRKLLDIELVDAITGALRSIGVDVHKEIGELREKEHGVDGEPVNLLESFYHLTSYNYPLEYDRLDYMQVRTAKVVFTFIASGDSPLSLDLVYRTPNGTDPDRCVNVMVNQAPNIIASLPMRDRWTVASCTIDQALLKDGANKLTIEWPYVFEPITDETLNGPVEAIDNQLFPVLGELHTLTLTAAAKADAPGQAVARQLADVVG